MTLPEFLSRHWEMLVGRLQGPLNFRFIMQRWIYLGQTLIVAVSLAVIPYLLVRGPVTRILRRVRAA